MRALAHGIMDFFFNFFFGVGGREGWRCQGAFRYILTIKCVRVRKAGKSACITLGAVLS